LSFSVGGFLDAFEPSWLVFAMRALALLLLASACGGGSSSSATTDTTASAPENEPAAETYASPTTEGAIARAELLPVLDAGFGRFLQGVQTEPHLEGDRFVGFRITRMYPDDPRFSSLELQPGDTVVRVNASPIERPEQALAVWNGLRVASELVIEYRRGEEARELRFAIVD
jgi:type II secretory pathway component PulC